MTAEEIADRFDISVRAAKIRLEELERMQRRKEGTTRPLPKSIIDFLRDAKRKGHVVRSLGDE
jgi:hypothetical protein